MGINLTRENMQDYVGQQLGVSDWFEIDQERINNFADATLDHQFIHIDVEKAKSTPFGTTIAHGFLTLSLLPYLVGQMGYGMSEAKMGLNYGCDKIRFLTPVTVGSRVRATSKLISIEEKSPGNILAKNEITVEIEGAPKPALIAEWLSMYVMG